jgi:hypothetical protein
MAVSLTNVSHVRNLGKEATMNETPIPQDHPIRLLPDTTPHPSYLGIKPQHVRRVRIAGKIFTVTPQTCYKNILSDGTDYYPYYDFTLPTADEYDHDIDFEQWLESMFERGVPE